MLETATFQRRDSRRSCGRPLLSKVGRNSVEEIGGGCRGVTSGRCAGRSAAGKESANERGTVRHSSEVGSESVCGCGLQCVETGQFVPEIVWWADLKGCPRR